MAKEEKTKTKSKTSTKKVASKEASVKTVAKVSSPDEATKFAIIEIAGTQVKVVEGFKYEVNKLPGVKGDKLTIKDVLMVVDGEKVNVGKPHVSGATVEVVIDSQKKDKKIRVFKFKSKSRYRRTYGHRSDLTRIEIKKISV